MRLKATLLERRLEGLLSARRPLARLADDIREARIFRLRRLRRGGQLHTGDLCGTQATPYAPPRHRCGCPTRRTRV